MDGLFPVVHSFEEFRLADTGICLATRSEAEEAMRELRSGSGLAILTTKQIEAGSEEIEFEVKTSQGLSTMWKRYLVQLGDVPVTYKFSAPRGGAVEADTSLVVIGFHKKYCHPDAWKTATTRPKSATSYWLKKLGAEPVDFLPPRSGGIDGVEVVARVQKDNLENVLRGSGEFGVFSRTFFVKCDARVYKDVPLPVEFDLQAALRKAKAVGPSILGVVLRGKGLGLRTKEWKFLCLLGRLSLNSPSVCAITVREEPNLHLNLIARCHRHDYDLMWFWSHSISRHRGLRSCWRQSVSQMD